MALLTFQLMHEFVHMLGDEYDDHPYASLEEIAAGRIDKPDRVYAARVIAELASTKGTNYKRLAWSKGRWVSSGRRVKITTVPEAYTTFALRGKSMRSRRTGYRAAVSLSVSALTGQS